MVNHKWNLLNAMRFYNRINKEFNAETYGTFYLGKFDMSQILLEIRRHRVCNRVEKVGNNLVLTEKGRVDLLEWERKRKEEAEQRVIERNRRRGHARPNERNANGSYAKRK